MEKNRSVVVGRSGNGFFMKQFGDQEIAQLVPPNVYGTKKELLKALDRHFVEPRKGKNDENHLEMGTGGRQERGNDAGGGGNSDSPISGE